jgi:hypothetical protein
MPPKPILIIGLLVVIILIGIVLSIALKKESSSSTTGSSSSTPSCYQLPNTTHNMCNDFPIAGFENINYNSATLCSGATNQAGLQKAIMANDMAHCGAACVYDRSTLNNSQGPSGWVWSGSCWSNFTPSTPQSITTCSYLTGPGQDIPIVKAKAAGQPTTFCS